MTYTRENMELENRQKILDMCDENSRWLLLKNEFLNPEIDWQATADEGKESFLITLPSHRDTTAINYIFIFERKVFYIESNGRHSAKIKFVGACVDSADEEVRKNFASAYMLHGPYGYGALPGFEMRVEFCN